MKKYIYKNYKINHFSEINSTNIKAKEMAIKNEISDKEIVIADVQTAGRGRKNRDWQSQKGNLFFSILLKPEKEISQIQEISFVSAVALQKTIEYFIKTQNSNKNIFVKNKWPNDILVNNKKISGILLESAVKNEKLTDFVVVGIGVNLVSHPEKLIFQATNLSKLKVEVEKEDFLPKFLDNFDDFYQKWCYFGFKTIRNIWLENSWNLNQEIQIDQDHEKISAKFIDIDQQGNLILERNGKILKITVGDVS